MNEKVEKPKWELGIWGYIILIVLFSVSYSFLIWNIIPIAIRVILFIGFWIFWFWKIRWFFWKLIREKIKKYIEKNPYSLAKLLERWLLALFLILLVFPLLGGIAPFVQTLTLFGIVAYTILFLLKRKRFVEQEKQEMLKNQKGFIQISILIAIIAVITAGVGATIVLQKQGKLAPLVASVSRVFEKDGDRLVLEQGPISEEPQEELQEKRQEPEEEPNLEPEMKSEPIPEKVKPKSESKPESEPKLEPKVQLEPEPKSQPETDPCADVKCSDCHYCVDGKCIARPDGFSDCGEGCQRCISGRCQDYDNACIGISQCENDNCIRKILNVCVNCLGTDTSCGCLNCTDCNKLDGWVNVGKPYHSDLGPGGFYFNQKQEYRDYFCSGTFCEYRVTKTRTNREWIKESSPSPYPGMGLPDNFGQIEPFDPGVRQDPGPRIPLEGGGW